MVVHKKEVLFVFLLILGNLIAGWVVLPGYGLSMDEVSQHAYAVRTIEAARTFLLNGDFSPVLLAESAKQGSHGPAFISAVTLTGSLLMPAASALDRLNFNHYAYFVVFVGGVVFLYLLARRWMNPLAAAGVTLLFNTQPLFVGHAFINPKDVVFMSLFVVSVTLGLWMVDRADERSRAAVSGTPLRWLISILTMYEVWIAAFFLGFASAIRIVGPLAGLIVLAYGIFSKKWRTLPQIAVYGLVAAFFMFLLWPYLWPAPVDRLIGSLLNSAKYPDTHLTLFRGYIFDSGSLPVTYVPMLFFLQVTIPVLVFAITGLFFLFRRDRLDLAVILFGWLVLPLIVVYAVDMHLYNNLRQLFFIYPIVFVVAGLALERLFAWVRRPQFAGLVLLVVLIPGVYANVSLYPYQYVYYNQLAGGLQGAFRSYELDYWHVAYKDAQMYINANALPDSEIYVDESRSIAQAYARPDLVLNSFGRKNLEKYDYIVVSTAQNADLRFARYKTVYTVERRGVPLAYVKKVEKGLKK